MFAALRPEPAPLDLLPRSAAKLWAERVNPVWWCPQTWLGEWTTDDRRTWQTTDGQWLAQLQRSANGRHTFLRLWQGETYVGYQDDAGWHPVTVPDASERAAPQVCGRRAPPLALAG